MMRTAKASAIATAALSLSCAPSLAAPAFPGAVGYGASADGWRGGRLMAVTTLADTGAGSLRACAEATGPRVCVFRVSGTVSLASRLNVRSDVYIAGQTAPGDGIQLKLNGASTHGTIVVKGADDVVVRFLKVRPGTGPSPQFIDAVTVENSQRVYLGNLSMMFATDETFNIHVSGSTVSDVTLADSILAYGLDRAGHPDGAHSKGALVCSMEKRPNECGRISIIRNLFAHNRDRNPDLKGTSIGPVEVLGNVFYNPISQFGEFYNYEGDLAAVYQGNAAITGPSTTTRAGWAVEGFMDASGHKLEIERTNNIAGKGTNCPRTEPFPILDPVAKQQVAQRDIPQTFEPVRARDVIATVSARAGDRLPDGTHRDALDQRVVNDLATCGGHVISNPAEVGGWPAISASTPPADSDGDLLPDAFETANGLDPAQPTDPWAMVGGVPAVELWLAALAGDR